MASNFLHNASCARICFSPSKFIPSSCLSRRIISCRAICQVWPGVRCFSGSSTSSADDTQDDDSELEQTKDGPLSIKKLKFPWRHSPDPLQRVIERNDLSVPPHHARAKFVRKTLAMRELGASFFQCMFSSSWEQKLAEHFRWAFQRGVAGLLSKTFQVHMDGIYSDVDGINIDTAVLGPCELTDSEKEGTESFVSSMLEENLATLYKHVVPSAINLKLKLTPVDCRLESIFLIPMFTRDDVRKEPSMKGSYQRIEEEFAKSGSSPEVAEMMKKLAEDTNFSGQRSIIADVSVECLEKFQVNDSVTGELLQGSDMAERPATHLVRFEMATTKGSEKGQREMGTWQVIDWDDMLEGNVWH